MITVTTRANSTALTTLDNVRSSLMISDRSDDAWLKRQVDAVSQMAIQVLGIEMAEDGTRNLGVETLSETLDRRTRYPWLPPLGVIRPRREADTIIVLGRRPVISIASITENGTEVDPSDYELFATDGRVKRLSSGLPSAWPCTLIVVNYTAGWKLPGDGAGVTGPALPSPIEEAVIEGIQAKRAARTRDMGIKSENIPGIREVQYVVAAPGYDLPLPPSAMAKLDPYRNMSL